MFLDDRSVNLLKELIRTPHIKNKELEEKFNLSRKQITYSIEKINQWLLTKHLLPISKSRNGNFIIDKRIFEHFSEVNPDSDRLEEYIPTEKERALLVILYLLGKKEEISLFHANEQLIFYKRVIIYEKIIDYVWNRNCDIYCRYRKSKNLVS